MGRHIRVAALAWAISHFEVPLYRLTASAEEIEFRVFYVLPIKAGLFDTDFGRTIDWGFQLREGYESEQVPTTSDLRRAARRWSADVMLLCGYGFPGAPRIIMENWLRGQPQVHRGTLNYHLDPRRPVSSRLMRPFGRLLLRLFQAHHYGGAYSRKVLLDAGVAPESLFFVPYSVDSPYFSRAADELLQERRARDLRRGQGWAEDDFVILFIAQHNWFKGPDIAMETFSRVLARHRRARLLVAGSGRMTQGMKDFASKNLPDNTAHFVGYVPSADTVPVYLASDLVLCSSRYETWGRMLNEAMLCRRPCLVSRVVPAAGDLVEDGRTGYVVDDPHAALFAAAVSRHIALTASGRHEMGRAARERALQFAYEPHLKNHVGAVRYAHMRSRSRRSRWR